MLLVSAKFPVLAVALQWVFFLFLEVLFWHDMWVVVFYQRCGSE